MNISVIGASNIDITARPYDKFIPRDSNPSRVSVTYGGVGRNIAHNLCLLGANVKFITCFGGDANAALLREDCIRLGMDISRSEIFPDEKSSYYICITDENGDLAAGASDMELTMRINTAFLQKNADLLTSSDAVVFDTNPDQDVLLWLCRKSQAPLFADAVSCVKAKKLRCVFEKSYAHSIHTLKMNNLEAQAIFDCEIKSKDDLCRVAKAMIDKGVRRVYITLGADGVFCADENAHLILPCMETVIASATGAGDAFLSAVIYATMKGYDLKKSAVCGLAAAKLALESQSAVSDKMNAGAIEKMINNAI